MVIFPAPVNSPVARVRRDVAHALPFFPTLDLCALRVSFIVCAYLQP